MPAQRVVMLQIAQLFALLHFVERGLCDVEVALVDQLRHLAIEERQQQRADVRTVDVGVGHDDDVVVAELVDVEVLAAFDAATERRDQRADLRARKHLFEARALDVEDLSAQRKNRLEAAIAPLLRTAARRVTLYDVELALGCILALAVRELAGKSARIEDALSLHHLARTPGRLAGTRREHRLFDDALAGLWILFEVLAELLVDDALDDAFDLARHQFVFGLGGKRWIRVLHRYDGGEPLTHVLAPERVLEIFEELLARPVLVDNTCQRRPEACQVRTPVTVEHVVGVGKNRLVIGVAPLHGDLHVDAVFDGAEIDDLIVKRRLLLVERLDELANAAFELVRDLLAVAPLVFQ